jgi:hypothetical protein
MGILNRTQRGKGNHTRIFWQKNQGTAKFKQKPVMMGEKTTYRTLSLKRIPFQNGTDRQSYMEKMPEKD